MDSIDLFNSWYSISGSSLTVLCSYVNPSLVNQLGFEASFNNLSCLVYYLSEDINLNISKPVKFNFGNTSFDISEFSSFEDLINYSSLNGENFSCDDVYFKNLPALGGMVS